MQKGKMVVKALQIAKKRKDMKGKGENERDIHLNAEFQRTAKRDKKAFPSDQCKEIEETNKRKRNRRYQGDISCKDGHSKGQK